MAGGILVSAIMTERESVLGGISSVFNIISSFREDPVQFVVGGY